MYQRKIPQGTNNINTPEQIEQHTIYGCPYPFETQDANDFYDYLVQQYLSNENSQYQESTQTNTDVNLTQQYGRIPVDPNRPYESSERKNNQTVINPVNVPPISGVNNNGLGPLPDDENNLQFAENQHRVGQAGISSSINLQNQQCVFIPIDQKRPYGCSECTNTYKNANGVEYHYKSEHTKRVKLGCPISGCTKTRAYKSKVGFANHVRTCHPNALWALNNPLLVVE